MSTIPDDEKDAALHAVLDELFRIVAMPLGIEEMLGRCLDALLSISWLSILPRGGVFLTETDPIRGPHLELVAARNLAPEILAGCASVAYGHCLCGEVARSGQALHTGCVDQRHVTTYQGMDDHGHYVIPIMSGELTLGVLVFYLARGGERDAAHIEFLTRAASVMSLAIELRGKQRELEAANRELEMQKRTLDHHAIVSMADATGDIIYANRKFCEISGYSEEELLGRNHRMLKSGEHDPAFYAAMWGTIGRGEVWHGEIKNRKKDGRFYWVAATIVPFMDETGRPVKYVAIRTDISERKAAEETMQQAQMVANMGSWTLDHVEGSLSWSDEIYRILGFDPDRFGASPEAFLATVHADDRDLVQQAFERSMQENAPYDIEHRIVRADSGDVLWVHERCAHQRDSSGRVVRSDGTIQDITDRMLAQEEVKRLAMTDQLTGVANRNQFQRRFADGLKLARRENMRLGLMLLDLDEFKPVNDRHGHQVGDRLLQAVAASFASHCRESDLVARIGGDEFAILLMNPGSLASMEGTASRIIAEVNRPIEIDDKTLRVGISIGLVMYPDDGVGEEDLMRKADKALYRAKGTGRNIACSYATAFQPGGSS